MMKLENRNEAILKALLPASHFFPCRSLSMEQINQRFSATDAVKLSCRHMHSNSCTVELLLLIMKKTPRVAKAYFFIHLASLVIFKRKKLMSKDPAIRNKTIKNFLWGFCKSTLFLQLIQVLGKVVWCQGSRYNKNGVTPQYLSVVGYLCYVPIFLEEGVRRQEITMYVVPKFFESLIVYFRKIRRLPYIPHAQLITMSIAMGIIANVANTEPTACKRQFQTLVSLIVGGSDKSDQEQEEGEYRTIDLNKVQASDLQANEGENQPLIK